MKGDLPVRVHLDIPSHSRLIGLVVFLLSCWPLLDIPGLKRMLELLTAAGISREFPLMKPFVVVVFIVPMICGWIASVCLLLLWPRRRAVALAACGVGIVGALLLACGAATSGIFFASLVVIGYSALLAVVGKSKIGDGFTDAVHRR